MVDDDVAVADVVGRMLRRAGYEVAIAHDAEVALSMLRERPVDVVLSDLRMPKMDGMALLAAVLREVPQLPVVLMAALGSVPLAVEAIRAGARDFVLKPFERDEVLRVIACHSPTMRIRTMPVATH